MNSADKIRQICADKRIPIGRVERELGFANTYLRRIRKDLPYDRLSAVAEYIGMTIDEIMSYDTDKKDDIKPYGIESKEYIESLVDNRMKEKYYFDPKAAQIAQEMKDNPGMRVLFDACRKVKPEDMAKVARMIGAFTEEE